MSTPLPLLAGMKFSLESIIFHRDGMLIEVMTNMDMFWLELAPVGWARFDKVANIQAGKITDHLTDRGLFALRALQSTHEPWPEQTMSLSGVWQQQSALGISSNPVYQAAEELISSRIKASCQQSASVTS